MALVNHYLKVTAEHIKEYGPDTLVLYQVGEWFEVYGVKDRTTLKISGSRIEDFARLCDCNTGEKKNINYENGTVIVAGFKIEYFEKFIKKLQDAHFTCPIYEQARDETKIRTLNKIVSPGTYFSHESVTLSNNITCIWLYVYKSHVFVKGTYIVVGVANLDVFTGETTISQFKEPWINNPTTFDELQRFISIYNPSEAIVISNLSVTETEDIIGYADIIRCATIHRINTTSDSVDPTHLVRVNNCEKQTYQMEVISRVYKDENSEIFMLNFYENNVACQAFCYLLDFVHQHSPHLTSKIKEPYLENCSTQLKLANHSLTQLNIIDDESHYGKYSSVSSMLNECVTSMGKRKFRSILLNPTTKIDYLNKEYELTEHLLATPPLFMSIRGLLQSINDMTKFARQLIMTLVPEKKFCVLLNNFKTAQQVFSLLSSDITLSSYFGENVLNFLDIPFYCDKITDFVEQRLNMEVLANSWEEENGPIHFFQPNVYAELDQSTNILMENEAKLEAIRRYLCVVVGTKERKKETEFVKKHDSVKSQSLLVCTNIRSKLLEDALPTNKTFVKLEYLFSGTTRSFDFKVSKKDIVFVKHNASDKIITNEQITQLCYDIFNQKNQLKITVSFLYNKFLEEFNSLFHKDLNCIVDFLTTVDVLTTKAFIAKKYNYCRPVIVESEKSFFSAKSIRHCLIEQIQTNELYVSNDVTLGNGSVDGILLYGTNAVGKTSLIRSLGIAIIMAQSGLFVPCEAFTYSPYKYIFTRILGNDNLFKGLSTFAVEMSELRTILRLADQNSLVLGDELCSGTENVSAISIFVAGIQKLHSVKSSFIFATHIHEIVNFKEISDLSSVILQHLTVIYDQAQDMLIYDRKMKPGPGNSMYGLEVCKSLKLPEDFLEAAFNIRMKYFPEQRGFLSLKTSHFNSKKIMNLCELCQQNKGTEVHHLQHQKFADSDGFIKTENGFFHKNTLANLVTLCDNCHTDIHKSNTQHKRIKTSCGSVIGEI
jgi:DNA mismatch repair protein MutS